MRKIFIHKEIDPETFNLRCGVFLKTGDSLELLKEYNGVGIGDAPSRYPKTFNRKTVDILIMIDQILSESGKDLLTEDEMYYIVDPFTLVAHNAANATPEEMARLAGYNVVETGEKIIKYFDDCAPRENINE